MKDLYTFRVKAESDLERLLDTVLSDESGDPVTRSRLISECGYDSQLVMTMFKLGQFCDNLAVGRNGVSYTNVIPQTVIQRADKVEASSVSGHESREDYDGPVVRWPDVPTVPDIDNMPWFRKPSWYNRMAAMVSAGKHVSLAGPPGIGKSSAVEYLAAEQGKVLVNISADAGLRRRDLTGNVQLVNSHTQFMVAEYVAAAVNGWWVKIDEVNSAEPDALMYLNSQMAPPYTVNFYGSSAPVHKDFRLFVTYNPGLVGTKPLPPAFKDRFFPLKLDFPTNAQLLKMLVANGMPESESWAPAIVEFGMKAWELHKKGRCRYQITPRRLMDAVTLVTMADENVFDALEASVIAMVDNPAEATVLKDTLRKVKQEAEFGRLQ